MTHFKTPKGTTLPILALKGKDYLQVAHRLVWFREECPCWRISTEFVLLDDEKAIGKATIQDENGNVMATAHKREDRAHFPDYMEKAEAGAIGRALAYCGYGTQFCADEIDEGERIVDAPQARKNVAPKANPLQVARETKAAVAVDPSTYVCTFGKYKNVKLSDIDMFELNNYCEYIIKKAEQDGKEITGQVRAFLDAAGVYLDSRDASMNELDKALS